MSQDLKYFYYIPILILELKKKSQSYTMKPRLKKNKKVKINK